MQDDNLPTEQNYIFVDVEDKRTLVNVYDHFGEFDSVTFVNDRSLVEQRGDRVVPDPYAAACALARTWAARAKCDWGANV